MSVLPEGCGFTGGKDFPCQVILIRIIRLRTTLAMKFGARHGAFESGVCLLCRVCFSRLCPRKWLMPFSFGRCTINREVPKE